MAKSNKSSRTATMPPALATGPLLTAEERVMRRQAEMIEERETQDEMMTELVRAQPEFIVETLELSRGHWLVFEAMGLKDIHQIFSALSRHRCNMELRAAVGDPKILAAARERVAAAIEAENSAAAELADLEVDKGAGPVLRRQIKKLDAKLQELTGARIAAEREVQSIEARRQHLRDRAPDWLKNEVGRDVALWQRSSREWKLADRLESQIRNIDSLVSYWGYSSRPSASELMFVNWARVHLPDAVNENGPKGPPSVDLEKMKTHVQWLMDEERPRLVMEHDAARTVANDIRREIELPLERWTATGSICG
jgi:hypothetical protein